MNVEDEIYRVNISGKKYDIMKSILLKIPYFANMINDFPNDDKYIFMQRSPLGFDHVLSYVIDNLYSVPSEYCYELDFYGIEYDKNKLIPSNKQILKTILNIHINERNEIFHNKNVIKCRKQNCGHDRLTNNLYCHVHGNAHECVFPNCTNISTDKNYCINHINESEKDYCSTAECPYAPIYGDYCFHHIR